MKTLARFVVSLQLAASLLALNGVALADDTVASQDPGIWQKHTMRFTFLGFTSTYSCDGLADKLKRLLIGAGARQDVKSYPDACSNGFGRPDKLASANLTFFTLTPPAAAAGSSSAAGAPGSRPAIVGTWRAVQFAARSPRELELGDCELIEQFRDRLLPLFTTRNVDDHTTCVPHQLSGSNFDLKFEAFVPFPDKPAGKQDTHRTAMNK